MTNFGNAFGFLNERLVVEIISKFYSNIVQLNEMNDIFG